MRIKQVVYSLAGLLLGSSLIAWGANRASDSKEAKAEISLSRAVRSAEFDVRHQLQVAIPEGAKRVRVWFVLPKEEPAQSAQGLVVQSNYPHEVTRDSAEQNRYVYVEARDPQVRSLWVVTEFRLQRREVRRAIDLGQTRPLTDGEREQLARYLQPSRYVVINDQVRKLASKIEGDETNVVRQARRIYDWVLHNIDYWVKDPGRLKASPVGSTTYCLKSRTGNCSDFHSLYASLGRAVGIPTRLVYGSLFKTELEGLDKDQSYHCWIEFYAAGVGWVPLDVAVADIYVGGFNLTEANRGLVSLTTPNGYRGPESSKVGYYFGNLDERRVTWSVGRDLTLAPPQDTGPVNSMPKAYVEVDGKVHTEWTRKLTYRQL